MADYADLIKMMIEVAVFAVLIYIVLRFLRETRGSGVVRGLAFLLIAGASIFLVLIQTLDLERLELLFKTIVQSVVIGLVIVFHPEIRRAIVHLGDSPIFGRFFQKESKIVQRVLRAVARMSKERIGALIAVEREGSLQTLAESGITIDAELNSFLIESIFYPKSALHDGAIVVRDDRIVAASCLLPLSQNSEIDKRLGTRHRAALGLSEETDALAIIVSEETGRISVAQGGKLSVDLTLEQLERHMDEALGVRQRSARRTDKRRGLRLGWSKLIADPVRKLAAVALGVGLWFVLDSQITKTVDFKLNLGTISSDLQVQDETGQYRLLVALPTDLVEERQFIDLATGDRVEQVELEISGPNYTIDSLRSDALSLQVALPSVDWEKVDGAEFSAADIVKSRTLAAPDVTLNMTPKRVRLLVQRVARREIELSPSRVTLDVGGDERLQDRIREETMTFSRPTVTVLGPAPALQELLAAPQPFVAAITAGPSDRQVTEEVRIDEDFTSRGLRMLETCTLEVQLRQVTEPFTLQLPVRVDDLSLPATLQGQYAPDQELIEVKVNVGGPLRSQLISFLDDKERSRWARNHMRLVVWIPPREPGTPFPEDLPIEPKLEVMGIQGIQTSVFELAERVPVTLRRRP